MPPCMDCEFRSSFDVGIHRFNFCRMTIKPTIMQSRYVMIDYSGERFILTARDLTESNVYNKRPSWCPLNGSDD